MRVSLLLLLLACTPVETGNPPVSEAALIAVSNNADIGFDSGDVLRVHQVWVSLPAIDLVPMGACEASDERVRASLPEAVDLVNRELIDLPEERRLYCGIELSFRRPTSLPSGSPPELRLATFVIVAERVRDGAEVRIAIDDEQEIRLDIEGPGLEFGVVGSHLLAWDLGGYAPPEMDVVEPGDDGVVRVDSANNTSLLDELPRLSERVVSFYLDANGNRRLDEEDGAALAKVQP